MKYIALIAFLIIATILWACCMAAATSDEQSEEIYRDYLEYKRKKEEEKK